MTAIEFNHVGKQYRLGLVGTGTLSHDLNRWWQTSILHHEDPYLKIGDVNDRAAKATSEYIWALRDIDFKVEQGDVVGIIGKNGAGKSTLLKLLSRVTAPTVGTINARGRIASLLEVGTGFHQEMTGRENIYMNGAILGMTKSEISAKLDEIIAFSGCEKYIDTPVKRYSSGMTVRLGFAVAAFLEPEILVVDEVLAVGDAEFQKKAIGKMQDVSSNGGRTVLFVSHNMASVRQLCTRGIVLDKGSTIFDGKVNDAIDLYLNGAMQNSSIIHPEGSVVKEIGVEQMGQSLRIWLKYESEVALKQPILGFVVYDHYKTPLFGTDSLKVGVQDYGIPKKKGEVSVVINQPIVVDGKYLLGIWFSEGKSTCLYSNSECLYLDIKGMDLVTLDKCVVEEGYIVPECKWCF